MSSFIYLFGSKFSFFSYIGRRTLLILLLLLLLILTRIGSFTCIIPTVLPLPDLEQVLARLSQSLNGEVKELLVSSKISKLISIYKSVMQQKQQQHSMPLVTVPSCDLVQEIITLLQEEVSSHHLSFYQSSSSFSSSAFS